MYKTFLLIILLSPIFGYSQNWELIQEDEIYYYSRSDSSGIVNSMRVDSTYFIGDSLYYVLRDNYLEKIDTCIFTENESSGLENEILNYVGMVGFDDDSLCVYHHNNSGSVLGKTIMDAGNGDYILYPGSKLIKTYAHSGDSWNYTSDLIASVVSEIEELNFGILDSVKLIEVNDLDSELVYSFKISKNHGLISYPFLQTNYFENYGTSSIGIGFSVEDFSTSLSLEVEDILVFRYFKWSVNDFNTVGVSATIKLEVQFIDTIDGEEVYHCTMVRRSVHFDNENWTSYYTTTVYNDFIYKPHSIFGSSLSAPGEIAPMSMIFPFYEISSINGGELDSNSIGFLNVNGSSVIYDNEDFWDLEYWPESVEDTNDVYILKGSYSESIGENVNTYLTATSNVFENTEGFIGGYLGHNHYYMIFSNERGLVYCGWEFFEMGHGFELTGSVIDGVQWGDIPSNSVLLNINEKDEMPLSVSVYPNPYNNHITVNYQENGSVRLKAYSLLGEELYVANLTFGETIIDMTSYNGNAFILKFISDKGITTKKVFRIKD